MTGDDLGNAARTLFGEENPRAIRMLSEAIGVEYAELARMVKGQREIPPGLASDVAHLLGARELTGPIAPPPDGLLRHLDALATRAEAAGWSADDVDAAVAGWLEERGADEA
jgi:hypothetical protein